MEIAGDKEYMLSLFRVTVSFSKARSTYWWVGSLTRNLIPELLPVQSLLPHEGWVTTAWPGGLVPLKPRFMGSEGWSDGIGMKRPENSKPLE